MLRCTEKLPDEREGKREDILMTTDNLIESPRVGVAAACGLLRCSRAYLNKLHKRGLLTKRHDGRKVYWLRDEVMAYALNGSDAGKGCEADA